MKVISEYFKKEFRSKEFFLFNTPIPNISIFSYLTFHYSLYFKYSLPLTRKTFSSGRFHQSAPSGVSALSEFKLMCGLL